MGLRPSSGGAPEPVPRPLGTDGKRLGCPARDRKLSRQRAVPCARAHTALSSFAPTTANGWLSILRVILKAAKHELGLTLDPTDGVAYFDTSEHETYTEEEPNALAPEKVSEFLACMREVYPHHYAMTYLGFATGLRPSSIRPLRRKGTAPDVRWDEGVILVRRSHSLGDEVMDTTKTKLRQRISVPPEVIEALAEHVQTQLTTPEQIASDL